MERKMTFRETIALYRRAFGKYNKAIVLLAVMSFVGGILEGVGVNAVIPLFSFVIKNENQTANTISIILEKFFSLLHIPYSLSTLLILIPILFIAKSIILIGFYYLKNVIVANFERDTRSTLFDETMLAGWPYLLNQKIGYLEKTIMVDVSTATNILSYSTELILVATNLLIYSVIALNISLPITVVAVVSGVLILFGVRPLIYKTKVISTTETTTMKTVAAFINENVYGMKTVKALGVKDSIIHHANDFFETFKKLRVKRLFLTDAISISLQLIAMLFIIGLFGVFYLRGNFNIAAFAVIIYSIQKIFDFVQSGQNKLQNIYYSLPPLENVVEYRDVIRQHHEESDGTQPFVFNDTLKFDHVAFHYVPNAPVISNLTFSIKKGEMIGLIGPSGAGKTTIVDLLLRLFPTATGSITLDGVAAQNIDVVEWRKKIGYVSQDIFLMNDTVENNIRFYNNALPDEQLIEAAKTAQIYNLIMDLPNQFKTVIGERGVMLSGGQRQRIILARVLARQPEVLILDEATSALDNESEALIQKAIDELKGKITVLAIAHRLSTVVHSDRLLVLEKGSIIEDGTPAELLKNKDSYFYKVYNIKNNSLNL